MIGEFEKIVEEKGVWIEPCKHRFTAFNTDVSFSFVIMTLCLSGTARALYDQREMTHRKNDLALLLPGHVMRPLECSEDYTYARIAISKRLIVANPELSLKEIAYELGFSEPTSFYRYFKRVTGLTANEFRHK